MPQVYPLWLYCQWLYLDYLGTANVKSTVLETAGVALSVTVNLYVFFGVTFLGVPMIVPVAASNVRPSGNAGSTSPDHVSGGVPPFASRGCLGYSVPTVPSGSVVEVIAKGCACSVV